MNATLTPRALDVIADSGETGEPIFRTPCSVGSGEVDSAFVVNGAVRKEIVELLECTGRKHLVDAAKTDPLVDVIGMLFSEISDNDSEAQAAPKLRERIVELEQMVADTHGPMQAQLAELNRRIVKLNEQIDLAAIAAATEGAV